MEASRPVRLVIPSELRLIDLAHSASEAMARCAGFDEDEALSVALAVREAVINAMLHGNREDPTLDVQLALNLNKKDLQVVVQDQGDGFDPDATPDPRAEENRMQSSGRGLLLMRAFVDEVAIQSLPDGGTRVTMSKRRPIDRAGDNGGEG